MRHLTASQLSDWRTYAAIEPVGDKQADVRHGQMMAMMVNLSPHAKEPVAAIDFMNFATKPVEKIMTEAEFEAHADKALGL